MTVDELIERKRSIGYTNEQIAELSGVPFGTVQKIFGRQTKAPRAETLRKIENVLFGRLYSFSTQQYVGQYLGETPVVYGTGAIKNDSRYVNQSSTNSKGNCNWDNEGVIARSFMPHKGQGEYTVDDVQLIPSDIRFELVDGYICDVGTPTLEHQTVLEEINLQFNEYIKENNGDCLSFITPLPVITDDNHKTEIWPDLQIMCPNEDGSYKFNDSIPDLVIEVLSPSTRKFDTNHKLRKYLRDGVKEYWIIDIKDSTITVNLRKGELRFYTFDEQVPVDIYDSKLKIDFNAVNRRIEKARKLFNK